MEEESIALIIGNRVLASQERHRRYIAEHAQECKIPAQDFVTPETHLTFLVAKCDLLSA